MFELPGLLWHKVGTELAPVSVNSLAGKRCVGVGNAYSVRSSSYGEVCTIAGNPFIHEELEPDFSPSTLAGCLQISDRKCSQNVPSFKEPSDHECGDRFTKPPTKLAPTAPGGRGVPPQVDAHPFFLPPRRMSTSEILKASMPLSH